MQQTRDIDIPVQCETQRVALQLAQAMTYPRASQPLQIAHLVGHDRPQCVFARWSPMHYQTEAAVEPRGTEA